MSVIGYLKHIYQAAVTVFDGLSVTFGYLFQKPITVQYPEALKKPMDEMLPDGYRGFLDFDDAKCTTCGLCQTACPIDCIYTEGVKLPGRKGKAPVVYAVDLSKCMFCGLCVDSCATEGLYFTKKFEGASYDIHELVHQFIPEELGRARIAEARRARAEAEAAARAAAQNPSPAETVAIQTAPEAVVTQTAPEAVVTQEKSE